MSLKFKTTSQTSPQQSNRQNPTKPRLATFKIKFPLMALALLALLTATWAGLVRLGWNIPLLRANLPMAHGPLIVSGFLGTLIGLERAIALSAFRPASRPGQSSLLTTVGNSWSYQGPILTALGALVIIIGLPGSLGPLLMTLGSLGLVAVFGQIIYMQMTLYTITMGLGAVLWAVGNGLWLTGWPIYHLVYWWIGFLALTIAGERLELNRVLRRSDRVRRLFLLAILLFLVGLIVAIFSLDGGVRLTGLGMIALALWLLRYDITRYTLRKTGLTRFMAICLLSGYGWLGLSGLLAWYFGGVAAGFGYDATLHAFFMGFVISMIFGHAPIILPAITGKAITFQTTFYIHLALLHLSLLLRVGGDLAAWLPGRQWGGLLNGVAILLFLANTGYTVFRSTNQECHLHLNKPET